MADTFWVSADDVLAGRVDLDALEGPYVFLRTTGLTGSRGYWEKLIRAANHMAKFGWQAVSYSQAICLVERVDALGR